MSRPASLNEGRESKKKGRRTERQPIGIIGRFLLNLQVELQKSSGGVPQWANFPIESFAQHFSGLRDIVLSLKADPEIRAISEESTETERGIRRDCPALVDDIRDSAGRNADRPGKSPDRQCASLQFVTKRATWVDGEHGHHPLW